MIDDKRKFRCAIYTRKSTDEGLDRAFNSLDAQREACVAYVASQMHEGWSLVPALYDDGGFSGGNMNRPGLKSLLNDVKAQKIDVIVVYKVDRLTRSLADFAKIVDVLDGCQASFVSVTQAFNTTTSMGRLTLNVLLSFAQFEREVTSERIRDKIAASKARGMWMGGVVPLGYRVADRKLVVVPEDAVSLRMIFARYLELGSVLALANDLASKGLRSRARISKAGKHYGDSVFSRGALYLMLQNRLYLGEMTHKGKSYQGEHKQIVEHELFDRVGALLKFNRRNHSENTRSDLPSLLTGLVWDGEGRRMTPNHAKKKGRIYRYYASRLDPSVSVSKAVRVPAGDLESIVLNQLRRIGALADTQTSDNDGNYRAIVQRCVTRIIVNQNYVQLEAECSDGPDVIHIPVEIVRTGKETRIAVPPNAEGHLARCDPALIKLIVKAFLVRAALERSRGETVTELARQEGYSYQYFCVLLRMAYLSPEIVTAILDGRQPVHLNRQRLARATGLPIEWKRQREQLGFA